MQTSDQPKDNKLTLKTCDGFIFPDRSEIVRFEAGHNIVQVFTTKYETPVKMRVTLAHVELLYPFPEFFLCHKSHLVNLKHVVKYEKKTRTIITTIGDVPLAESKVEEFKLKMGLN